MRYIFIIIIMLAASAHAQNTVVIQQGQQPLQFFQPPVYNIAEQANWNIQRNAAIGDALRYEQLRPPTQIQIQKIEPQKYQYEYKLPESTAKETQGEYEIIE